MDKTATPYKTDRIIAWLDEHPGQHAPRDVAAGAGIDPSRCASLLLYLTSKGRVQRFKNQSIRTGPGSSLYSRK